MKTNPKLLSFAAGVGLTAALAAACLHSNNIRWQNEAFKHKAGWFSFRCDSNKLEFHWMDDLSNYVQLPKQQDDNRVIGDRVNRL
jgi:hypothetical protein